MADSEGTVDSDYLGSGTSSPARSSGFGRGGKGPKEPGQKTVDIVTLKGFDDIIKTINQVRKKAGLSEYTAEPTHLDEDDNDHLTIESGI